MRVRLFNAKFSPNLGDGLLSECLERALIEAGCSENSTYSVDLAGRVEYGAGSTSRSSLLNILHMLPAVVRRLLIKLPLEVAARLKWRPHYRAHLKDADAVVIGGGNLFADLDLNFPTKLSLVLQEARRAQLPVFIYGVGVGGNWSARGISLLTDALAGVRIPMVAVRDQESKNNFDRNFSKAFKRSATIVRDPGLLVSRYVDRKVTEDNKVVVGICITSAIAIRYHSEHDITNSDLERWFVDLYFAFENAGYSVQIFTNGSPEDVQSAESVADMIVSRGGSGRVAPQLRSENPSELAALISGCQLIIAFRMHALIAAYSYGSELIALKWDRKLDSFMNSVGLGKSIFWPGETSPAAVLEFAKELFAMRAAGKSAPFAITEALHGVRELADAIHSDATQNMPASGAMTS